MRLAHLLAVLSLVVGFKAFAENTMTSSESTGLSVDQSSMNENALTLGNDSEADRPGGGGGGPIHGGGAGPAPGHGGGFGPSPVHGGGPVGPGPVHGGGYGPGPGPVHGGGYGPGPVHGGGYGPGPVHGGGYGPVHGEPGHGGWGEPGWHGGGPRPGWYGGWHWDYNDYPYWYHVGFIFPIFVWAPEAPFGEWQCEAFDQFGNPYFASAPNQEEAAYDALYDCGGENYAGQCYVPAGYCRLR